MPDDDPGHRAMLYLLELLMNSAPGGLTVSQLAGRFGSRNFTSEMRSAAGGNEAGLKRFLQKFPSLFLVTGNMVTVNPVMGFTGDGGLDLSGSGVTDESVDYEVEAVKYFEDKMMRKEDKWIPIKSLAGHLSQASPGVRQTVGPQTDFKDFLFRHPDVFDAHEEIVSLQELIGPRNYLPVVPRKVIEISEDFDSLSVSHRGFPQKVPDIPEIATRSSSMKRAPVTMTANEYKALTFLKSIVEKKGGVLMQHITGHLSQASESVRNTIGWTQYELEEFVRQHPDVFEVSEQGGHVTARKNSPRGLNAIITGSKPQSPAVQTLCGRSGRIYHVAKLWGIVDLGKHEHVFFDRSIYHKECDDLQDDFSVGEVLHFDAVLAPKKSRAKWRATHIWKDGEPEPSSAAQSRERLEKPLNNQEHDSSRENFEDEMRELFPSCDTGSNSSLTSDPSSHHVTQNGVYSDAPPSSVGGIPVWNFMPAAGANTAVIRFDASTFENGDPSVLPCPTITMVPESYFMHFSCVSDIAKFKGFIAVPQLEPPGNASSPPSSNVLAENKTADVACQTTSTGDILTSQLYYGENCPP